MSPVYFSIVIPTYNRSALVAKTIESLLKQTFTDFEIIVVDDGGTDNSKEVVESIGDPRVRYYWKENAERGAARNYGSKIARGKWVNFFDSDDVAYPNHLETAHQIISADPAAKVFHTSFDFMEMETGKISGQRVSSGHLNKTIQRYNSLSCNNVFIEKKVADAYAFCETRCVAGSEDWLLWLKLSTLYPIIGYSTVTTTVILHSGRSMVTAMGAGTEKRAECFMEAVKPDQTLLPFRKNIIGEFYSLAALNYAVEKKRKDAWRCSRLSIKANPWRIFSRRFLATIKHII